MSGQTRVPDIPKERLAVDFGTLLPVVALDIPSEAKDRMGAAAAQGITKRMAWAAELLSAHFGSEAAAILQPNPSDTVRGWAAYCRCP